jgi:hypothetical protein
MPLTLTRSVVALLSHDVELILGGQDRSVPLDRYARQSPLVLSWLPRCQGRVSQVHGDSRLNQHIPLQRRVCRSSRLDTRM